MMSEIEVAVILAIIALAVAIIANYLGDTK